MQLYMSFLTFKAQQYPNIQSMRTAITHEEQNKRLLKAIAKIKQKRGFKCRNCSGTKYYEIGEGFARKCKHCKRTESVIANTIFAGQRVPVATVFSILEALKENVLTVKEEANAMWDSYFEWRKEMESIYGRHREYGYQPGFERKLRTIESRYIIPSEQLAKMFDLRQKTIWALVNKLANAVPEDFDDPLRVGYKGMDETNQKKYGRFASLLATCEMNRILEYYVTLDPDVVS